MASSNRPTGLHFGIVFTSLAAVIFAITTGVLWRGQSDLEAKAASETTAASKAQGDLQTVVQDNTDAMTLLGGPKDSYANAKQAMEQNLRDLGRELAQPSVLATLQALRSSLDGSTTENTTLKADLQAAREEIQNLRAEYQNHVDQHKGAQDSSEAQLQKANQDKSELVGERDRTIAELNERLRNEQVAKEQLRDELAATESRLNGEIRQLEDRVDQQRLTIENLLKTSFEVADGQIVTVDANQGLVYINLGELDNLRPQVSFSVYSRDHRGIGREAKDIKGQIEVTDIIGPHLAAARILGQDQTRPISEDDPIYSPIWAGGRQEYFGFVGLIDLDNDGKDDRPTLHRILNSAGAGVELEVDNSGNRQPADAVLSVNTRFLVLGDIPDPSEFAGGDERQESTRRMMQERNTLLDEARRTGVRVVNLDDFLSYIGYRPQQRYFVPGSGGAFPLKSGSRPPAVRSELIPSTNETLIELQRRSQEGGLTSPYRN